MCHVVACSVRASMKVLSLLLRNFGIVAGGEQVCRCLNESPELIAQECRTVAIGYLVPALASMKVLSLLLRNETT